jgi:hypothetical protein
VRPMPIDLTDAPRIALNRMLETGDVVGRDQHGRTVIMVAVEDWMFDWLMAHGSEAEDLEPEPIEEEDGC